MLYSQRYVQDLHKIKQNHYMLSVHNLAYDVLPDNSVYTRAPWYTPLRNRLRQNNDEQKT